MAALTARAGTLNGTASLTAITVPYPSSPLTSEVAYVSVWSDNTALPTCTSSDNTWQLIAHVIVGGCSFAVFWARVASTAPATVTVTNSSRTGTQVLLARLALVLNQNASGFPYYGTEVESGLVSTNIPSTNVDGLQNTDASVLVFTGVGDNGAITVTNANSFSNVHSGNTALGDQASLRMDRRNISPGGTPPIPIATPAHSYAAPDAPWARINIVATSVAYTGAITGSSATTEGNDTLTTTGTAIGVPDGTEHVFDHAAAFTGTLVNGDAQAYTLATSMIAKVAGTITGVSFYRNPTDTTTSREVGIWTKGGPLLAHGVSVAEPLAGGWTRILLETPLHVSANQQIIVGAQFLFQAYVSSSGFFTSHSVETPYLLAHDNYASGYGDNGVFHVGTALTEPNDSYNSSNYWIDVDFAPDGTGPSAITGTAAQTEASDTLSAAGKLAIKGTLATTDADDVTVSAAAAAIKAAAANAEASDTLVATGKLTIQGSAAQVDGADTVAGTGSLSISGSSATSDGADSLVSTGSVLIRATASQTDAADSLVAGGSVLIRGTAAQTEDDDTLVSTSGGVGSPIVGSSLTFEAYDTLVASGLLLIRGSSATTDESESTVSSGVLSVQAMQASIDASDTLVATAQLRISGSLAKVDGSDTLVSTGRVWVSGAAAQVDAGDVVSGTAITLIAGQSAATEGDDTLVAHGTSSITGAGPGVDGDDTLVATGKILIKAAAAQDESPDTLEAIGSVPARGRSVTTDEDDVAVGTATLGAIPQGPRFVEQWAGLIVIEQDAGARFKIDATSLDLIVVEAPYGMTFRGDK